MMNRRTVAAAMVGGLAILVVVAIMPFIIGVLGAPILAVAFAPLHARLLRRTTPRVAASGVVIVALLAVLIPMIGLTALIVLELPSVLGGPGVDRILGALATLHVGRLGVGTEIAAVSQQLTTWVSRQAIGLIGSITFIAINLLIAFLGLFYVLVGGEGVWDRVVRYLPFSSSTAHRLSLRFREVTRATLVGIGVTAVLQASVVGFSFYALGLSNALLWGAVTGVASILPILGSSLVWLPGVVVLLIDHRPAAAVVLAAIGFVIASNLDNLVRPIVFRRVSHIHPLVAVVGAFAGMRYFGLLGVLIGPLGLVYLLELVKAYDAEFGAHRGVFEARVPYLPTDIRARQVDIGS